MQHLAPLRVKSILTKRTHLLLSLTLSRHHVTRHRKSPLLLHRLPLLYLYQIDSAPCLIAGPAPGYLEIHGRKLFVGHKLRRCRGRLCPGFTVLLHPGEERVVPAFGGGSKVVQRRLVILAPTVLSCMLLGIIHTHASIHLQHGFSMRITSRLGVHLPPGESYTWNLDSCLTKMKTLSRQEK